MAVAKRMRMASRPLLSTPAVQYLLVAPVGQAAHLACQSMVKADLPKPPPLAACRVLFDRTGPTTWTPRVAGAVSNSPAEVYPASRRCSAGRRPLLVRRSWISSTTIASLTVASVVTT
ncbi:hypothetical protein I5Q34_33410 [Streptomyces sp. AV19]|uniref:hypothetical protein n=1 Tax=Streptomyces sp. AV19 TaxID=2793068 RepID=UPI0018FEC511|nr:hypothetical protein [Streptomyces sp. AV19]MBH1939102.1 hypothetical protein [Streptomyces sp. AV19]MDG4536858.1 hypothetical protein [Streptomyces sp. AV19]